MKAFEGTKTQNGRNIFAISISADIDETNTIESEFRLIKESLVNWEVSRGATCSAINLVITADEAEHPHIAEYARYACEEDIQLAPLLARCAGRLVVADQA